MGPVSDDLMNDVDAHQGASGKAVPGSPRAHGTEGLEGVTTVSGIEMKPLYTPEDLDKFDYQVDLG